MVELKSGVRAVPEITRINTIQKVEYVVIQALGLNLLKGPLTSFSFCHFFVCGFNTNT